MNCIPLSKGQWLLRGQRRVYLTAIICRPIL